MCDILNKPVIRASEQLPPNLKVSGKFILSREEPGMSG